MNNGIVDQKDNKRWYLNGKLHRVDGPAIEYSDGGKVWCTDGKMHRLNGPAVEYYNGEEEWFIHGKLHREDGPAINFNNGGEEWFFKGRRHRISGPAITYAQTYAQGKTKFRWYIFGKKYTEENFNIKVNQMGLNKELFTV